MELKIVEYDDTKHREIKMFCLILLLLVTPFVLTYFEWIPQYAGWGVLYLIITVAMLNSFYRKGETAGRIVMDAESISIAIPGHEAIVLLKDLEGISLKYTNCYKPFSRYFFSQPNILSLKIPGGYEKSFQIVIEGKRQRNRFKQVLFGYREKGMPVEVKSVVSATWNEF